MKWDNDKSINYVYGDKLSIKVYISNIGGGAFNGKIRFKYFGRNSSGNWVQIKDATTEDFYVAGKSTASATSGTIEKTEGYDQYTINCFYIDPATDTEVFVRRNSDFEFRTATTYIIEAGDYGCNPEMKYKPHLFLIS